MPRTKKQKEQIPTLLDNNLHNLLLRFEATKTAIKTLETKRDALKKEIEMTVEDIDGGKAQVVSDEFGSSDIAYTVNLSQGANSRISREKLLERGVSPAVIDYATDRTEYVRLVVKEVKVDG